MARKLKSDRVLFFTTIGLVAASVVMVYSASNVVALDQYGRPSWFLVKQCVFACLGLAAMALAMHVNYRVYKLPAVLKTLLVATVLALVGVLFLGPKINNTHRWYVVAGVSLQPSELAKLATAIFAAFMLERRMDRIDSVRQTLLPIGIPLIIVITLIMSQPDFGNALAVLAIAGVVMFAAGLSYRYLAGIGLCTIPMVTALVLYEPYRLRRWTAFWNPELDPRGDGFQVMQSLIAVGTGGVTGRGLSEGVQKLWYLPYAHTDFIYAVIAEELGLIGATVVLLCFCVITWRGLRIVSHAPDAFASLLALGLTVMIALQAFVNISVVLGLVPTKGIPLPFVSAGGSSLVASLFGMGMLLNISQHASAEG